MPSTDTRAALEREVRAAIAWLDSYGAASAVAQIPGFLGMMDRYARRMEAALARSAPEERGEGLDPGKVAAQVLQSIADSEPDENTIEAQEILRGTPYEMMYVLNGDVIERHVAMAVENALEDALLASPPVPVEGESFQARVQPWMLACFGAEISADQQERCHRFLEESLELVQSLGCTRSEAHQLVDYVFGRPVGETHQEVGGVMVTLAALCLAVGEDMHAAGEDELARIWTKVEKIRAKQAAKPKHSPLPEHVTAPPAPVEGERERAVQMFDEYAELVAGVFRRAVETATAMLHKEDADAVALLKAALAEEVANANEAEVRVRDALASHPVQGAGGGEREETRCLWCGDPTRNGPYCSTACRQEHEVHRAASPAPSAPEEEP